MGGGRHRSRARVAHPEALAAYENALELWPSIDGAETLAGLDEVELLRRATEAATAPARSSRR